LAGDTGNVKVLVVDDDPAVRESLDRALRLNGFEVSLSPDGVDALNLMNRQPPDAVVLDVMMPNMDGLEVCRRLRAKGDATPILMLTAQDEVSQRVAGLDAGADDYLPKPFALDELLARLRALLRRASGSPEATVLAFADLTMDLGTLEVRRGSRVVSLSKTEHLLLELFLRNPRRVLTRDLINEQVWGYDFPTSSNSLEVYVGYLRRKLEAEGEPRVIQTVRGFGYVLKEA
jgi:two-component system response regulator MprA